MLVLSGAVSSAHVPSAPDGAAHALCPAGTDWPAGALARVLRRCRPILFASELLRSLSIVGWREHLAASPCGPRGCVCGVSGVIHQEWHALVRLLDASTAHLCRSAWISHILSIVLPSVPP